MTVAPEPDRWGRRVDGTSDRSVIERLARAMRRADENAIRDQLEPDVVLIVDDGGLVEAMDAAFGTGEGGRDRTAAVLASLFSTATSLRTASINGAMGVVFSREGRVCAAVVAQVRADLLSHIWVVRNPEKLRHWNRR
ncbi:MAG: hypothetical protein ACRDT7_01175 [Microbacterium sp.]